MKASPKDTRIVEIFASTTGSKVTLTFRSWWHKLGNAQRRDQETRMVRATMPVPLTNDDLIKYAEAMARFCVDPSKRAFRPPNSLVWQEVPFGQDETQPHGEEVDGRPFPMDPLPLFNRSTEPADRSTILSGAKPEQAAPPEAARSSAREPTIRPLGAGRKFPVDRG